LIIENVFFVAHDITYTPWIRLTNDLLVVVLSSCAVAVSATGCALLVVLSTRDLGDLGELRGWLGEMVKRWTGHL
jgi:hypothetical protein